jgi:hypothetical protein
LLAFFFGLINLAAAYLEASVKIRPGRFFLSFAAKKSNNNKLRFFADVAMIEYENQYFF